jgi:hypothetical protein
MNATTKYVVSRTLKDADAWQEQVPHRLRRW